MYVGVCVCEISFMSFVSISDRLNCFDESSVHIVDAKVDSIVNWRRGGVVVIFVGARCVECERCCRR